MALLGVLPGRGCPKPRGLFSWGRKSGPRESQPRVREPQGRSSDLPETPAGSRQPERERNPLPPPDSKPPRGSWEPVAAGRSERGRSEWGGAGASGAGPAGAVGGGACGLQVPSSAVSAGLRTAGGSAQPERSSQVRTPRVGGGGPGTAGIRAGRGQDGREARGGSHKPRDRPSWDEEDLLPNAAR